jgi:hypothetical protein
MVIGCVLYRHHDWMRHYFIREINPSCIFDEYKANLQPLVSPQGDVRFKIMDMFLFAVVHFLSRSNEEQVHYVDKSFSAARAARLPETTEEPKSQQIR